MEHIHHDHSEGFKKIVEEAMTDKKQARVQASMKYNKANIKQIKMNLNRKTDADIIQFLENEPNVQGLIKQLIREHMKTKGRQE